jgi:hypothetical protein
MVFKNCDASCVRACELLGRGIHSPPHIIVHLTNFESCRDDCSFLH